MRRRTARCLFNEAAVVCLLVHEDANEVILIVEFTALLPRPPGNYEYGCTTNSESSQHELLRRSRLYRKTRRMNCAKSKIQDNIFGSGLEC